VDAAQRRGDRRPVDQPAQDRWLTGGVAGIAGASFLSYAGHEIPPR
jgi:hypothetical protein